MPVVVVYADSLPAPDMRNPMVESMVYILKGEWSGGGRAEVMMWDTSAFLFFSSFPFGFPLVGEKRVIRKCEIETSPYFRIGVIVINFCGKCSRGEDKQTLFYSSWMPSSC